MLKGVVTNRTLLRPHHNYRIQNFSTYPQIRLYQMLWPFNDIDMRLDTIKKIISPCVELKRYPTSTVGIGKGHAYYSRTLPHVAKYFLGDGNRPFCEDRNHIDIVARHDDEPHATENATTNHLVINTLGRHKTLFGDNFAI